MWPANGMLTRVQITGASSGIGRATAFAYHKEGAKIVCADIQESTTYEGSDEENGTTHDRIRDLGGSAIFQQVDVRKPASVAALVEAAVKEYGRLDIMVNNAGMPSVCNYNLSIGPLMD